MPPSATSAAEAIEHRHNNEKVQTKAFVVWHNNCFKKIKYSEWCKLHKIAEDEKCSLGGDAQSKWKYDLSVFRWHGRTLKHFVYKREPNKHRRDFYYLELKSSLLLAAPLPQGGRETLVLVDELGAIDARGPCRA
jgi:hypothetical protein